MNDSVSDIVAKQRAYFHAGATRPVEFRMEQLSKLSKAIHSHGHKLTEALRADLRKSPEQAYGSEISLVLNEIDYAIRHLRAWVKPVPRRMPLFAWRARAHVLKEPFGIALVVGAWNYPVQLLLMPAVSAMAAGNCTVLKPSEVAPNTASAINDLINETFAPEYVSVVQGGADAVTNLIACRLDMIFFTGSHRAGTSVMAAAAAHPTPTVLELGGKSPCVVCADAPIEVSARRIVWGKYLNAGQTCVAPDFVLVDRRIKDPLIHAMKQSLLDFYGSNPQQSRDYGRIVNRRHFDRLHEYLSSGRIVHGAEHDAEDLFLAPTIITDVPQDAAVMQDEIFGPILPVLPFDDLSEAIAMISNRATPLAAYVFTENAAIQRRFIAEVRSGGICINDVVMQMVGTSLPFGGLAESGFGCYHGEAGFDCFSHRRAIVHRRFRPDIPLRYPPSRFSLKTMKRAIRYLLK